MARYQIYEDDDTGDITSEREKFDKVYAKYSGLLRKTIYLENFDSIILSLRLDENLDPNVKDEVERRIENDIHDGLITKPTRSLDEIV